MAASPHFLLGICSTGILVSTIGSVSKVASTTASHKKYDSSFIYEDEDGVSTEECTKRYSNVLPKVLQNVFSLAALGISIVPASYDKSGTSQVESYTIVAVCVSGLEKFEEMLIRPGFDLCTSKPWSILEGGNASLRPWDIYVNILCLSLDFTSHTGVWKPARSQELDGTYFGHFADCYGCSRWPLGNADPTAPEVLRRSSAH